MINFRSLRVRMVVFLVALLGLVQITEFALTNSASYSEARGKIEDEFSVGERVFARVLRQNSERLSQAAGVLAADFAFREAVATGDTGTLESALENQGARINAKAVLYIDLKGQVIADTLGPGAAPHPFELPQLIAQARTQGGASTIDLLHHQALQLIAVPVKAPVTIGWIVVCFPLDLVLAQDLKQLTGLDVSFARESGGQWHLFATTLPATADAAVQSLLPDYAQALGTRALQMPDGQQQLRLVQLGSQAHIVAVLQRPIASAMAGFRTLRNTLLVLGFLSLAFSIAGSVMIALSITRPIERLLAAVKRIRGGDYAQRVEIARNDEIGALANGLDHMRTGIAEREQRILKLAYEDPLTQLPNRSQFAQALEQGIVRARQSRELLAIMVMDLDRFKYVNDSLGHGVGDHVLREVGARLRRMQGESGCVARLGGDEFALLVPASTIDSVIAVAKRIIAALEIPIVYEGQPLDVGTSIGIAMFPTHGENSETLVRNADIAMYVAKRSRTGWAVYEKNYDTSQQEHLSLLGELRHAVEHNELRLHYQPKVDLTSATVSACEALLRWDHPRRGVVPPAAFIPFAEHTGYIKVLTRWVLEEAVRQIAQWRGEGMELQVSVNISARDLLNRDLPDMIGALLAEHRVPASLLCLEITESGFMEDPANAITVLEQLAKVGLQLSIDDYGTGYSSLSYLMRLPAKEMKIDRSFVSRVSGNASLTSIVSSTIELGHRLGMKVVAEGVEDSAGYALLRDLGCDTAQGYYMSPPLPPADFTAWMKGRLPGNRVTDPMPPGPSPRSAPAQSVYPAVAAVPCRK
ncbi:MAG TPA: EAL domain-containing protein [Steroidobacteraceae bacterium]|nr:EAL domain-containing protein [Steroidobacteraceae bacterium]